MARNIAKQVREGKEKLNSDRTLTAQEIFDLISIAKDTSVLDAIVAAFYTGAATGMRQVEQGKS